MLKYLLILSILLASCAQLEDYTDTGVGCVNDCLTIEGE